jgi:CPA2 family monovalent cation:H+ antiporter-2
VKSTNGEEMTMKAYLLSQLKNLVLYASIIIALMLICFSLCKVVENYVPQPISGLVSLVVSLVIISPFLWAVAFKHSMRNITGKLMADSGFNRHSIHLIFILRIIIVWGVTANIINHFLNVGFWSSMGLHNMPYHLIALGLAVVYVVVLRVITPVMHWYERIESKFLENMNKRDTLHSFVLPEVLQDNFTLDKIPLSPKSQYAGLRIRDCDFRKEYNVSVVSVDRADEVIDLPSKDLVLFPADEITLIGTEEQLAKVRPLLEVEDDVLIKERPASDVDIFRIEVDKGNRLLGTSLRESNFRHGYNAMVIAVERDGEFLLNPQADIVFQEGDTIWFVASEGKAKAMAKLVKVEQ